MKLIFKILLATKTLYDLVAQKPEDEVKLQALYSIFSMNFEKTKYQEKVKYDY